MARVLVIDDDEMVLALVQRILSLEGFETLTTADGPQGLALFKERHPDIILLDLALPGMNGLEVLRKIRQLDEKAKVIVVTGSGSDDSAEVALRYGACDFVRKPVDYADFVRRIKAALPV
jgi:DNA-binding response OmpR family regulator